MSHSNATKLLHARRERIIDIVLDQERDSSKDGLWQALLVTRRYQRRTASELDLLPRYATSLQVKNYPAMDHWLPLHPSPEMLQDILTFARQLPQ